MKRIILILSLLLALSMLFGERASKIKTSLNLGLLNGASLGLELGSPEGKNREHYLNINGYYNKIVWFAGANYEIRTHTKKGNLYHLLAAGVDYGEMYVPLFSLFEPDNSDEIKRMLIPHLVVGIGYRFNIGNNSHMFIEWDMGVKPSLSNINLGVTF
ncbi:MAG: hypothetical protein ACOYIS_00285 [Candidatus Cloacimonadaceae bacterium]|jgi:hypothetical protein